MQNSLHKFAVIQMNNIRVYSILKNVLFDCGRHAEECVMHDLEELCGMSLFGAININ
jgi:hypothetical protein